jgi:hypothetical protein
VGTGTSRSSSPAGPSSEVTTMAFMGKIVWVRGAECHRGGRAKEKTGAYSPPRIFAPVSSLPELPGELSRSSSPCGAAKVDVNPGAPICALRAGAAFSRCLARRCFTMGKVGRTITSEILLQRYVPGSCIAHAGLIRIASGSKAEPGHATEWVVLVYTSTTFLARRRRRGAVGGGIVFRFFH